MPHDPFFERPTIIYAFNWTTGVAEILINPWQLWANDPMVLQRLKGTGCWSGTLNLRFDLAANPHQYGLLRANFRFLTPASAGSMTYSHNQGISRASQYFGVNLDPSLPGAKEMSIPLINQVETISCTTTGQFASTGLLALTPIVSVYRDDSAASTSLTLIVRAWVTGMKRYQSTRFNAVAQSSVSSHHYSSKAEPGMFSKAGSVISNIGNKLSSVPVIGSSAKAIATGGELMRTVADLFGFSRPLDDQSSMRHVKMPSSWGTTDVVSSAQTCAVTAKQGRDLDVSDLGISNEDQMSLSYICGHESNLVYFNWAQTDGYTALLGTVYVDPTCSGNFSSTGTWWDATSVAYATLPFNFWRGSLIFTFRIITSPFFTGKLRIAYEPQMGSGGTEDTTWPWGALENCTLDCLPGATAEITVGWSTEELWNPVPDTFTVNGSASVASNGALKIYVENVLQGPLASQGVAIIVSVRGGPDYQLFGVKEVIPGYVAQSALSTNEPPVSKCHFGSPVSVPTELDAKVFGERVVSLRSLLKAYTFVGTITATSDATGLLETKGIRATFNPYPPDLSNVTHATGSGITYVNAANLFSWFRLGYAACRGGTRYRFTDENDFCGNGASTTTVGAGGKMKVTGQVVYGVASAVYVTNLTTNAGRALHSGSASVTGAGCVVSDGGLLQENDFQFPDYNPYKFNLMLTRKSDVVLNSVNPYPTISISKQCVDMTQYVFGVSFAVADDFSFLIWQGPFNVK